MIDKYWDDFIVGDVVVTYALTVTEAHVVGFAGLTGDYYPLHMNEEYARSTKFGTRIAHGPLTFCLAVGLVGQTHVFGNSIIAFLGVREMTLKAPVKFGDTIYVKAQVIVKRETSNESKGITTMRYDVLNQHDTVVLSAEMNFLMQRRK